MEYIRFRVIRTYPNRPVQTESHSVTCPLRASDIILEAFQNGHDVKMGFNE